MRSGTRSSGSKPLADCQIKENARNQDHQVVSPGQVKKRRLMDQVGQRIGYYDIFNLQYLSSGLPEHHQSQQLSPTATSMLATVPSSGATTGISIFIASRMIMLSPAFTACPTDASIFRTLPGYRSCYFNGTCTCCLRCCFWSCFWCCFRCCLSVLSVQRFLFLLLLLRHMLYHLL